jgi:Tfp pilus assembly protein FimV
MMNTISTPVAAAMAYSQNSSEIILQLGGMDAPESEIQQSGQQECDEQATHLDLDTCEESHMETAVSDDKPSLQDNTPLLSDNNIQTLLDCESGHTSNHHQLQPRIIRVRRDGTPEPKPKTKLRRMTKHISDDEVAFALGQPRFHDGNRSMMQGLWKFGDKDIFDFAPARK